MFKMLRFAPVILLIITTAACAPQVQYTEEPDRMEEYTLGEGDQLRVIVYGRTDMSGDFTVDSSGNISMPLIKTVNTTGLTVAGLQEKITDELQPEYLKDPKVSVEVIKYRDVYVLGEVRNPGKYPYIPNMRGLQAVAVAGGHTYRADELGMEINRQTNKELKVYTTSIKSFVQPGDTIIIRRRLF